MAGKSFAASAWPYYEKKFFDGVPAMQHAHYGRMRYSFLVCFGKTLWPKTEQLVVGEISCTNFGLPGRWRCLGDGRGTTQGFFCEG